MRTMATMLIRIRRVSSALLITLSLAFVGIANPVSAQSVVKPTNAATQQQAIAELSSKLTAKESAALEQFLQVLAKNNGSAASLAKRQETSQILRQSLDTFTNHVVDQVVNMPAAIGAAGSSVKASTMSTTSASWCGRSS